jgi:hypothetical protein
MNESDDKNKDSNVIQIDSNIQKPFIKRQDIIIYNDLYVLTKERDEPKNSTISYYSNTSDNEVDKIYENSNENAEQGI